ncbi:MAG TPA: LLM class flavin-dependent oxidoreductase [Candidatus Binatia bacterium]|nr:LLM class flavin-dependent oxidoreductase [Candidatus Binatia bacterium]
MKFVFFHLMPYTGVENTDAGWPVPNGPFDPRQAAELYRVYVDTLAYADECDFDWIGCNEHHFSPYGMMSNPNIIAGALAFRTKRAKIAVIGNLVPLNNPIRIAEEYAMIDCMTGGRLVAGLMRGIPHEYIAYNIPPSESWERQREAVALIKKAWTEPQPFGWEGKHYRFRAVSIWPRPFQQPHPPLVVSATTIDSARFAAEIGATMGMVLLADYPSAQQIINVYRETAREHGWEPTADNILIGMHCCIAETDDEALEQLRSAQNYFQNVLMTPQRNAQRIVLQQTRYHRDEQNREHWESRLRKRAVQSLEEQIEAGVVLCGSPETVVKQIKRANAELGNGIFNLTMKVGNLPDAAVRRGMELFRDRVKPHVRDAVASPATL